MPACAPLRILYNGQNLIRTATLTPSSVLPVADTVFPIPAARQGTASVALSGDYTGTEDATIDIEIVDDTVDVSIVSAPLLTGVGSGTIDNVSAPSFAAQNITIELANAGVPELAAAVDFEGVKIVARAVGDEGNLIHINIDQSGLVFTATNYSTIAEIPAGAGGETTGLVGAAYDYDTKVLGADNVIPTSAHRIAFGEDTSAVYLQYKQFVNNEWVYHFVPALRRSIPRGTVIKYVTGGRTVQIIDDSTSPASVETYSNIETRYDLLSQIRENSTLVAVDGVVAYDRSPTGQASQELLSRTDAHVEPSTGTGSRYAQQGFSGGYAEADAGTELIIARCYAITGSQHPLAHLGAERWTVEGSLSGALDDAVSGVAYIGPSWGFLIPQALPTGYGTPRGRFSVVSIDYAARETGEIEPPICPVALELGPNAVDQTVTLTYKARPSGDCNCTNMPLPRIAASCLGTTVLGDTTMAYSAANQARLEALYTWAADLVRNANISQYDVFAHQAPFVSNPMAWSDYLALGREYVGTAPELAGEFAGGETMALNYLPMTFFDVITEWERTLQEINDTLNEGESPDLRGDAEAAWDVAVAEFEADIDVSTQEQSLSVIAYENLSPGDAVGLFIDNDGETKVRKAISGLSRYGFVIDSVTAGGSPPATITVYFYGNVTGEGTGLADGGPAYMYNAVPGDWTDNSAVAITSAGAVTATVSGNDIYITPNLNYLANGVYLALLSDRYKMRMNQVLITGGISPAGKSEASILESGDGCWRDWGGSYWWEVVGSEGGKYAPAFTNKVYYASRPAGDRGAYFSTKEFALQLNVKCPQYLQEGDRVTLAIGDAAWTPTYQVGDEIIMAVVAAQDLYLAGGQDGNALQTWTVTSDVLGPFPNYVLDPDSPLAYSESGLTFEITQGAIPFGPGDRFGFAVEGGHYRYRVNSGAWQSDSPPASIPDDTDVLVSGLSATFTPGEAPSFVADDRYSFRVLQPWAASNITTPQVEAWAWDGSDTEFLFDLGSAQDVACLAVALHTLPDDCTISVEGAASLSSPFSADWSETLTWREGPIFSELDTAQSARYLRLVITNAPDASIGWFYAGPALTTTLSADLNLSRAYKIERASGGLYQGGRSLAKAVSGTIEWTEGALPETDVTKLQAMLDWVKGQDDEPILVVPNVSRPEEAFLGRPAVDEVEFPDVFRYGPNAGFARRHSTTIPVAGVWR